MAHTREPKILLDCRFIGYAGIGRWVEGMWRGLVEVGADVVGIWPSGPPRDYMGAQRPAPAGPHVSTRARAFRPQEQLVLPRLIGRVGAHVYHAPTWPLPYLTRRPVVLTVHDVYPYIDPTIARSRLAGSVYRTIIPLSVRKAHRIVAISPLAVRQLQDTFGVGEDRLRLVEHGIDHDRFSAPPNEEVEAIRARFRLPETYLLYVGTLKPHKNLNTLLAAHCAKHPPLVLAGPSVEEFEGSELSGLSEGVVIPVGRVQEELPALYAGALALVLPSLYESAPFPPLEAMACRTAVICSDGGGMPELVGEDGLAVPVHDVEAWREALTAISEHSSMRERLAAAGYERVRGRSWARAARQYVEIYREAVE